MGRDVNVDMPFGLFVTFWCVGVLCLDSFVGYSLIRQARTTGFTQTPARITRSELIHSGRRTRTAIEFEFRAAGHFHKASDVRFSGSSGRRDVQRYPLGAEVNAYFNPRDPSVAVLRTGLEPADLFPVMFAIPFNSSALLFFVAGPIGWLLGRHWNVLRGPVSRDSQERAARMISSPGRIARALLAASFMSLPCVLVLGFLRMEDSWPAVSVAMGIICLSSTVAAILPAPRWLDTDNHYAVNKNKRVLKLPTRAAGIIGRTELGFDEIQDIRVLQSQDKSPLRRSVFDVVVTLKTDQQLGVDQFSTAERAQRTAEQLLSLVFLKR